MLVSRVYFLKQIGNKSWSDSSVLVVILGASHGEGLTGSCLPVTENAARVAIKCTHHDLLGRQVEYNILRCVHEHFLEVESPLVLLMVDDALVQRSFDVDSDLPEIR